MRSSKIILGTFLLAFTIFALISGTDKPVYESDTVNSVLIEKPVSIVIDKKEVEQYENDQEQLRIALKTYFDKAIASGNIVGAGVSIVKGDSIVIANGFGKRNNATNNNVNGKTVFRLGSLSKGFTGVLAAGLKNQGKLNWNDKVQDYLPEFRLGSQKNTDKITLANILSHTAGTPYHSFTNLVEAGLPLSEIAKRFIEVTPISEPGKLYSYQNALFALSGEIIQKTTGEELSEALQHTFFEPLKMYTANTDYETLTHLDNVAMPHTKKRNGWRSGKLTDHYDNAVAAGGVNASALDMGKWMRFLLGHNSEVMKSPTIAEAFNPFIQITGHSKYYQRWDGHVSSHYAFGWRIHKFLDKDTNKEKTMWHHGGSVNNFRNEIAVYPETDLGICVLLNSNSRLARNVIPDIHEIVKKVYEQDTIEGVQNSIADVAFLD